MKNIFSQMVVFLAKQGNQRNLKSMMRFMAMVVLLIIAYSALFHVFMLNEGREYSAITGLYWTLTVMSTLGTGDICFTSDIGKMFSVLVTLSGILLFMMVMPFAFVRFVYVPWIEAQKQVMVPYKMPETMRGHVIVTGEDSVAFSVVDRLRQYAIPYVHILTDHARALERYDQQYSVMIGELDSPKTYRAARVENAALVAALSNDFKNTNTAATVRGVSSSVRIAGSVNNEDSLDILHLAGCNYTYNFSQMLGEAIVRRVFKPGMRSNLIAVLGDLNIVEVPGKYTPYEGKNLKSTDLRSRFLLTAVGIWHGKQYKPAMPETIIDENATLLLAGTAKQVRLFDGYLAKNAEEHEEPVLILGGGRVGIAVARTLEKRGMDFRLVEKEALFTSLDDERFVLGSAADIDTLRKSGIGAANTVIVTTNDDDLNIYLTIYCRKLRPDIQIISRATLDRNVESLYSAGASLVMSHASIVTSAITNLLKPGQVIMLTEGLNLFRSPVPKALIGVPLKDSNIRQSTQCNVVAISSADGVCISPDLTEPLVENDELVLIGTMDAERAFKESYPSA